jgi:hypothetical protein
MQFKLHHKITFVLPIYCQNKFLESVSEKYGWVIDSKHNIGIPIIIKSKYFFDLVIPYGNIYDLTSGSICDNSEKINLFYQRLLIFLKEELRVDGVLPSPAYITSTSAPHQSKSAKFGSLRVDLNQTVETLWSKVHSKHRNSIRMAEKMDCKFVVDNTRLNEAIKIINETHTRANISLVNEKLFLDNSLFKVILVLKVGIIQSVGVFTYSNEGAYYLYGSNSKEHEKGSMNFLHWNTMLYFKEIKVQNYDFVGVRLGDTILAKHINLRRFKARFGGETKVGFLWKINLSIKYIFLNYLRKLFIKDSFDIIDSINKKGK